MNKKDAHRAKMLKEIMSYQFTAIELTLYLDTHPTEQKALAEYNQVSAVLNRLVNAYEQCYGPLTVFGSHMTQYPWSWIDEPWPWEVEF